MHLSGVVSPHGHLSTRRGLSYMRKENLTYFSREGRRKRKKGEAQIDLQDGRRLCGLRRSLPMPSQIMNNMAKFMTCSGQIFRKLAKVPSSTHRPTWASPSCKHKSQEREGGKKMFSTRTGIWCNVNLKGGELGYEFH